MAVIAETISHYHITSKLGAGGMGEVYLAEDSRLGRQVALKFLPEAVSHQSLARERLFNEVRAAREITHPQVCRVHDVGEMDGQITLLMAEPPKRGAAGMVVKTFARTEVGDCLLSETANGRSPVVCREFKIIGPVVGITSWRLPT